MPAALCGSIIGKGGATIRQFAEDSKAAIGLSPQVRRHSARHVMADGAPCCHGADKDASFSQMVAAGMTWRMTGYFIHCTG